jgi:uncharacterized ferritin-like protein (DUF455 family)
MGILAKDYTKVNPDRMHDVTQNARKLSIFYTIEVELSRLIGSWVPRVSGMAEKLALSRILYEDADHANHIQIRLLELRLNKERVDEFRQRTAPCFTTLEHVDDEVAFMAGLFRVVKPALLADYRRHIEACPPYVDEPSVRFLRQIIAEQEEHIGKGLSLLADRGITWADTAKMEAQLRDELWDLTALKGNLTDGSFVGKNPVSPPRPTWPDGVEQLPATADMPEYPGTFDGDMQRVVHDLVFSELEAAEIFALYVYEYHQCPWQFHWESARICWDEARHVELLLNVLERYGGHVGQFPAKAPGYEEFMHLQSPVERMIMVSVIAEGEVSTDTQTQHREAFRKMGDDLTAMLKDYEMADEIVHGQFGGRWAKSLAEQLDVDYDTAFKAARAALSKFKAQHPDAKGGSQIPLVRLGSDEEGSKRTVNITAKKLLGYSDEEIDRLVKKSGGTTIEEKTV